MSTEKESHNAFLGLHLRAKNINRWPLMSVFKEELLSTHIYETSVIAHLLGVIAKVVYNEDVNPERVSAMATFHEGSEVAGMGDIPSPVKYSSPQVSEMFKSLENEFETGLLNTLPAELREYYQPLIKQDKNEIHARLAKSSDLIAAFLKCKYEISKNNMEFSAALEQQTLLLEREAERFPCVKYFIEHFLADASTTIDEQAKGLNWIENTNLDK